MRVRHRPPALVSMWMLDVFCCALGCVTLLFLLNGRLTGDAAADARAALRRAEGAARRLADADQKLTGALAKLDAAAAERAAAAARREELLVALMKADGARLRTEAERDDARKTAADTAAERDAALKELAVARTRLEAAERARAALEKRADATAAERDAARADAAQSAAALLKKQKDFDAVAARASDADKRAESLQKQLALRDADRAEREARLSDARKELGDLDKRYRDAQKELSAQFDSARAAAKAAADELATARAAAKAAGAERDDARAQLKELAKKVDGAETRIIDLQGDKAKLADRFDKLQKETEARFAGIAMTGRRAVFVVDMSGSMGKRDLTTADPTKWPLVVETVCQVMRSVPTLEQYQVVVFSSSARWLFESGDWRAFEGERSVEAVRAALLKIRPVDDTNVYAALDRAFALRASGLDTVYLFSDGLPTSGPGLTAAQERANLSEAELGAVLGKHVRDTLARAWNRPLPGQPRVRVNAVGFYFDSAELGAFLWNLARENDGHFVGMSRP